MLSASAPVGMPVRRRAATLLLACVLGVVACTIAFLTSRDLWQLGLLLAAIPFAFLCLARPVPTALVGLALLPWAVNLAPGLPLKVSATDVLLGVVVVAIALSWSAGRGLPAARSLVPLLLLTLLYAAVLLTVNLVHLQADALVDSFQRLQLVLVPLLAGVLLLGSGALRRGLTLYVLSSCLLALAWMGNVIPDAWQLQKNPVGQFLVGAILVALAVDVGKLLRILAVPLLSVGLLSTASRGAILGLLVGLMLLLIASPGLTRMRLAAALVPLAAGLVVGYALLPDDIQERTTTFSAASTGAGTSGQYTIKVREEYRDDALDLIGNSPLTGVGIGNYLAGDPVQGDLTNDPHNFLLLEAAEGGLVLAGALVVLLIGSSVIVFRRRAATPLAPVAVAVQASLIAHGLFDVYWVRGTPVLGWLLVAAALTAAARSKEHA